MGKNVFRVGALVALSGFVGSILVAGCSPPEPPEPEQEEHGTVRSALCANGDGVNSVLAAIAVSTAKELGRWNPTKDMLPKSVAPWTTELTLEGLARCPDGCPKTAALLRLQTWTGPPFKVGNTLLNTNNLRSTLAARWNEQKNCELRGGTGAANCTAEEHKLTFVSEAPGACDTLATFRASKLGSGEVPLQFPSQLKNKLLAYGGTANPYLAFSSTGTTVTIDPVPALVGTASAATPSSCLQVANLLDPSHAQLGRCCQNPAIGVLSLSTDPAWLICKTTSCTKTSDCNDNDPCTVQACQNGGCVVTSRTCCTTNNDCSDGNPCTTDTCTNGSCGHSAIANCCVSNATCNDGNPCTTDTCNLQTNKCVNDSATGCCTDAQCADTNPCSVDACTIATHACTNTVDPTCCVTNADCNDGNACSADTCNTTTHACTHAPVAGCCTVAADCADTDPCTTDTCDGGTCKHASVAACCRSAVDCDDGKPCTQDLCAPNTHTCQHNAIADCCTSGADCADSSSCTADSCSVAENKCVHAPLGGCCTSEADCDDGDPCTTESCNTVTGTCVYEPFASCCRTAADCGDADSCTADACVANKCTHAAIANCCANDGACNDGNACTDDACAFQTCSHVVKAGCCAADTDCDDKDACTKDTCSAGICGHDAIAECCKTDLDCHDGDACTSDKCVDSRCTHAKEAACIPSDKPDGGAPSEPSRPVTPAADGGSVSAPLDVTSGGCTTSGSSHGANASWVLLGLAALARRRRIRTSR